MLHKALLLSLRGLAEGCEVLWLAEAPSSSTPQCLASLCGRTWSWEKEELWKAVASSLLVSNSCVGLVEPGVLYRIRVAAICGNVISDQQLGGG